MKIQEVTLHQASLPLRKPYQVSFRTYTELEPILVEMRDKDGNVGWGEAYIPTGASFETTESGWIFCREYAEKVLGKATAEAKAMLDQAVPTAPYAATAMLSAIALLERHPILKTQKEKRIPLLVPMSGTGRQEIGEGVERLLQEGYRTFKIKVGRDLDADLKRVAMVQDAAHERATITIDANRAYTQEQGCTFASSLDPKGIDLFEQPCEADAWDANAAVAKVSKVPLMLDESIDTIHDVERAATIEGVKLVKLKLKRVGGIDRALALIRRAQELGLNICLGDGVASELMCWIEASVGRDFLRRAGDMNGFLKAKTGLFSEPLPFEKGAIVLKPDFWPTIDRAKLDSHEVRKERFAPVAA